MFLVWPRQYASSCFRSAEGSLNPMVPLDEDIVLRQRAVYAFRDDVHSLVGFECLQGKKRAEPAVEGHIARCVEQTCLQRRKLGVH